jgi:very-short-patch-repair endonuclease
MEALAKTQHGLITRAQALENGLSRSAIQHRRERGRWSLVARGVYRVSGAIETPRQRALVAVLASGSAVLSHASAAALHGLPGFGIEPLTVSLPRDGRRSLPDVRQEQSLDLPVHHRSVIDGIPCTTVARTLFDLCGDVHALRAERALDSALARRLVTLGGLWQVLVDLAEHGRAGTVLMRQLLEDRRDEYVPPESELEARLIALARQYGLPEPERQVDLGDDDGWIGRVDFLFRGARIVVEVDGAAFHDGLVDRRHDAERDARLSASGWYVLRFRWDDVVNRPAAVAHSIRFRCQLDTPQRVETTPKRAGGWVRRGR